MSGVDLSSEERSILMDYKRAAPHVLVRAKSEALLLLDRGVAIAVVAEFVDRVPSTVATWVHEWSALREPVKLFV